MYLRPRVRSWIDQFEMTGIRQFGQARVVAVRSRGALESAADFEGDHVILESMQQPLRYAQRQQFNRGGLVVTLRVLIWRTAQQLRDGAAAQTQFPGAAQVVDSGQRNHAAQWDLVLRGEP